MTRFGVGRGRPSDFQSTCTAFGPPQARSGQSMTLPTCGVSKTYLVMLSFDTTEGHYIMGQSRIAGRALARAIGNVGRGPAVS